jgi:hypothetical protein
MNNKSISIALSLALVTGAAHSAGNTNFNPDISLILDGRYSGYSNNSDYELPGFMLGGEAGRGEEGFHLGHNELAISANVDDMFYGKMTAVIADHEGETEVELEEAFIETLALGNGFTVKGGRFFSGIGYLNEQHPHAWDFADAPLVYSGMFGNQLRDDGVQVSWVAPTDLYLKLGGELTRGENFPAGGAANDGKGAGAMFAKIGGDVGASNAWQLGLSHWQADIDGRTSGGHAHGGGAAEIPTFTGDSSVNGIDFVWKWAPNGNATERNLKLQAEYFVRDEEGTVIMDDGTATPETTTYDGTQSGWYAQAIYQFMPHWRVGLRYDQLDSDNTGSDTPVLGEAGLDDEGHTPKRSTIMVDYSHSEYSRLRLQYAKDGSYEDSDNILMVQYIISLGPHGAHKF